MDGCRLGWARQEPLGGGWEQGCGTTLRRAVRPIAVVVIFAYAGGKPDLRRHDHERQGRCLQQTCGLRAADCQ